MLDTPATNKPQTAAIHLTVPCAEIQSATGSSIQDLISMLEDQGIEPLGKWFLH